MPIAGCLYVGYAQVTMYLQVTLPANPDDADEVASVHPKSGSISMSSLESQVHHNTWLYIFTHLLTLSSVHPNPWRGSKQACKFVAHALTRAFICSVYSLTTGSY